MASEDREDFLTEDPDIPGQKFCLISFLSPEKVLAKKDHFFFEKFLNTFEFNFRVKSYEAFLMEKVKGINDRLNTEADKAENQDMSGVAQVLRDSRVRIDELMGDLQTYFKDNQSELKASKIRETYDEFYQINREKLEDDFFAANDFRTTVRGIKIRGTYGSKEEAVARSKKLQRIDPVHNIFLAEIGKWLPWDPDPSQIPEQEYAEEKLNTLMKKYKENEEARENFERENRERLAKLSKKPKVGMERVEDAAPASIAGEAAPPQDYTSMFSESGPADLAIARKMERDAASK
jgi:hypothetical protein